MDGMGCRFTGCWKWTFLSWMQGHIFENYFNCSASGREIKTYQNIVKGRIFIANKHQNTHDFAIFCTHHFEKHLWTLCQTKGLLAISQRLPSSPCLSANYDTVLKSGLVWYDHRKPRRGSVLKKHLKGHSKPTIWVDVFPIKLVVFQLAMLVFGR